MEINSSMDAKTPRPTFRASFAAHSSRLHGEPSLPSMSANDAPARVKGEAVAECVSDEALIHLKSYKYSAVDKSPISHYILRPYARLPAPPPPPPALRRAAIAQLGARR